MKKTFRNLICILLIVAVLFPANLVFAASGKDAAKVIEELGIAPTVKFPYFHNNYSRVEFAYILANLDSEYMSGMQATIALKDVAEKNADHAAYAVSKGYLPLDAEGNFRPNDNVTYSEAVVALVKLLGYGDMAESNGGTVSDYISTARWIELTNGAPASLDGHLSKDGLASMVLNAMEIPPATKIYDGGAIVKGITILKDKNLSVVVKKLLATPTRGIGADVCDEGFINLGGTLIRTDKTIDDSLVGRMVRCYIQNDDGVEKAAAMVDVSGETLMLNADDIYDISVTKTQTTFKYGDGEKVSIPHTATVIINGKPGDLTRELLNVFTSGTMEVFDSDGNGSFDTVDMSLCITEVVESASTLSNAINTKYTNQRIVLDQNENAFSVYENGENVGMSAIKPGSVVNIACDAYTISNGEIVFDYANAEFVKVYVSNRKVTGMLELASSDEYVIDGRSFTPNSLLTTISGLNVKNALKLASTYKFSIDAFGAVVDYELVEDETEMQYGYLMNAGSSTKAFNVKMQVQILNNDSELKVYDVREKYILDGNKEVINLGYAVPAVLEGRQLIRYKVSGGMVTEIDTATVSENEVADTSLSLDFDAKDTALRYWGDYSGFEDHRTVVSSDTKVFYVTDAADADEDAFQAESPSIFGSSSFYNYQSFDIGEMGKTGCILVYASISDDINFMNRAYMLEAVEQVLDDDDAVVTRLYLHGYKGSITKDLVDERDLIFTDASGVENSTLADLEKGDIVRFAENANGKVTKLERAFAVSKEPAMQVDDLTASDLHYEYGTFYNTNSTHFEVVPKTDLSSVAEAEKFVFSYKYPVKVPVYNMIDGTITLYSSDYQNIPSYTSSAEKVTVFIHMGAYATYSTAVYIWD